MHVYIQILFKYTLISVSNQHARTLKILLLLLIQLRLHVQRVLRFSASLLCGLV